MKKILLALMLVATGALAQFDATEICFGTSGQIPLVSSGACASWIDLTTALATRQFWTRSGTDLSPTTSGDSVTVSGAATFNSGSGAASDLVCKGDTATNLVVVDGSADSFEVGTTVQGDLLKLQPASTVFNEAGADIDWRLESDIQANAISLDSGLNGLGLFADPTAGIGIYALPDVAAGAAAGRAFAFGGTVSGADPAILGIQGSIRPQSPGPLASSYGVIAIASIAPNTGSGGTSYNVTTTRSYFNRIDLIQGYTGTVTNATNFFISDPTLGTGPGIINNLRGLQIQTLTKGANNNLSVVVQRPSGGAVANTAILVEGGNVIFNENSNADSFRVESDGNANMLFVDGTNNRVGIGTGSPTSPYELETFGSHFINGQADEVQETVQAHSTQTSNVFEVEKSDGTDWLAVTGDGRIFGTALHNNAGAVTGTTSQYLASGTFTPTLTNVTNITASTAYVCQWMRVGNVVTVSGKVDIDVTLAASSATELGISLPIASALTAEEQLGGTATSDSVASLSARIKADATNDRASLVEKAISLTNDSYAFSFTYLIL